MQSEGVKRALFDEVNRELERATSKFGSFASAHEGYAVLLEEVDELWDDVKHNRSRLEMRGEAIQIAAMALRFVIDVCDQPTKDSQHGNKI